MVTIRKAIEEMRKVSSNTVQCNNGTKIIIWGINSNKADYVGKIKWNHDGSIKAIRGFFCSIKSNDSTVWKEFPKDDKHWMFAARKNPSAKNDYYLSEREMNGFISDNGGIDYYNTIERYEHMMSDATFQESNSCDLMGCVYNECGECVWDTATIKQRSARACDAGIYK